MSREHLDKLKAQERNIRQKVLEETIRVAKEEGKIVDSIDDLVCDKHRDSKFKVLKGISDFYYKVYLCEECEKDSNVPKISSLDLAHLENFGSIAYECPICKGIVVGGFETRDYTSSQESWQQLAGRGGVHYHCKICDTQLGHFYWKVS